MSEACRLSVNGAERTVLADGAATLLTVLREQLTLTGAKRGCNQGVCGACTVLIDGEPMRACLSLALNCAGSRVTTVEAMAQDPLGRRLQAAFAEAGAVQCGFCTPGMLAAAWRLLTDNPDPGIDEIRAGLSGNLCRCSGYRKIIDAVRLAARP
jgi:carbon-monoxide dehydrogenase small subunit